MMNEEKGSPKLSDGLISVPAAALSVEGEDGSPVVPVAGDEVEVSIKGVVETADDGGIKIKPSSFNGVESEVGSVDKEGEKPMKDESESPENALGAYKAMLGGKQGEEVIE